MQRDESHSGKGKMTLACVLELSLSGPPTRYVFRGSWTLDALDSRLVKLDVEWLFRKAGQHVQLNVDRQAQARKLNIPWQPIHFDTKSIRVLCLKCDLDTERLLDLQIHCQAFAIRLKIMVASLSRHSAST